MIWKPCANYWRKAGDSDPDALQEQSKEAQSIAQALDRLELETLLGGEHDGADAIVEIKAGAGGTDACDWVTMLQRMYLKWGELRGFKVDVLDESEADIAGLTNTTFVIHGKNAYGYMKIGAWRASSGPHLAFRCRQATPDQFRPRRGGARHRRNGACGYQPR